MTTTDDSGSWTPYVLLLGGVTALGGVIYASYKASQVVMPYALAYGAPELLPHYEAVRAARTPQERREKILAAIGDLRDPQGEAVTLPRPAKSSYPVVENWQRGPDLFDRDEIGGCVFGKSGIPDGTPISFSPIRVEGDLAFTERSTYQLGKPAREKRKRNHPDPGACG